MRHAQCCTDEARAACPELLVWCAAQIGLCEHAGAEQGCACHSRSCWFERNIEVARCWTFRPQFPRQPLLLRIFAGSAAGCRGSNKAAPCSNFGLAASPMACSCFAPGCDRCYDLGGSVAGAATFGFQNTACRRKRALTADPGKGAVWKPVCACLVPGCAACFVGPPGPQLPAAVSSHASGEPCSCFAPGCSLCSSSSPSPPGPEASSSRRKRSPVERHSADSQGRCRRRLSADVAEDAAAFIDVESEYDCVRQNARVEFATARQRRPSMSALQMIGRPKGERWTFIELYAGCRNLTFAVAATARTRGLKPVGPAVDILGLRLSVSNNSRAFAPLCRWDSEHCCPEFAGCLQNQPRPQERPKSANVPPAEPDQLKRPGFFVGHFGGGLARLDPCGAAVHILDTTWTPFPRRSSCSKFTQPAFDRSVVCRFVSCGFVERQR